ncbi:ankyrin repeat-containing domain protein [Xylaria curta]|nr:ankyrin repeat-containing domain protein [Xylaria curta]
MSSSGSSRLSEEQWLHHQALIRRLYIVEDKPLRHIVDQLRDLSFLVTTSQLEYKLKTWNLKKNISKKNWIEIDHCISKRKREGKDSEVILCGKRLKLETVEKETNRYRDRSIFAQLNLQPTSSPVIITNNHVLVSTPPSFSVEFEWPSTLPWFQFPESEIRIMLKNYRGITLDIDKIQREALIPAIFPQGIIGAMNTVQFSVSKLATVIKESMPESYSEQSLQRVQSLENGSRNEFLFEALSMVAYMLSNNNILETHREDEWRKIMTILKASGLFQMRVNLKTLKSHTINGFMEKLYNAAIIRMILAKETADDNENMAVLQWLLAVGQSPTLPHQYEFWRPPGVIERPVGLELVSHLLEVGADADILISGTHTILELILHWSTSNSVAFRLAQLLLEHGASVRLDYALHLAIRRRVMDKALIEMIIRHGGNLLGYTLGARYPINTSDHASKWYEAESLVHTHTALSVAAVAGLSQTQFILDLLSRRNPLQSITDFITADVLISAIISKDFDIVYLLYNVSGSVGPNDFGIWPLHAAAYVGYLDIFQILFASHGVSGLDVTSTFSPLHFACYNANLEIVQFLITKGANVNAVAKYKHSGDERREWCILDLLDGSDMTPLDLLFYRWNKIENQLYVVPCVTMLIHAGVKPNREAVNIAAINYDVAFLSVLLNTGVDLNEENSDGYTVLQEVLYSKCNPLLYENRDARESLHDVVKLLLENGATPSGDEIISAISYKDWDLVALILRYGGRLLSTDELGTALEAAVRSEDFPSIAQLFDIMPTIYNAGSLCAAIETQQNSTVQRLLLNRRTQPVVHELEVTAIGIAAYLGQLDLLHSLLQYPPLQKIGPMPIFEGLSPSGPSISGFKIPTKDLHSESELWESPLALIATKNDNETFKACSVLLKNGFEPDRLTWAMAADSNNIAFVQFLFDNGQRYKKEKNSGHDSHHRIIQNPLVGAIRHSNEKLAALLLEVGLDINDYRISKRFDRSPLQLAVELGNFEFVRFLTKAKADVNSPPAINSGATALQIAAIKGHLGIAKYLLDLGAEVNAPPAQFGGRTALEGAAEWGRLDMLELLLSSGACITGAQRPVRAVAFALKERHYTAADLLKESLGWSEEDELSLKPTAARKNSFNCLRKWAEERMSPSPP